MVNFLRINIIFIFFVFIYTLNQCYSVNEFIEIMIRYFIFEQTVQGIHALAGIRACHANMGLACFPVVVPVTLQGFNPDGVPEACMRKTLVSLP